MAGIAFVHRVELNKVAITVLRPYTNTKSTPVFPSSSFFGTKQTPSTHSSGFVEYVIAKS